MADDTAPPTPARARTEHTGIGGTPLGEPGLGAYLRRVADALAAPQASTDEILAAARARAVKLGEAQATFRPPDPHFVRATVEGAGVAGAVTGPESVIFECDTRTEPVRLRDIEAAFGSWSPTPKPATELPIWPVRFDHPYRRSSGPAAGGAEVVVLARVSENPVRSDVPVVELVLLRQPSAAK